MEQFDYKYEMKKILIISAVLLVISFVFFYFIGWNILPHNGDRYYINHYFYIILLMAYACLGLFIIWKIYKNRKTKRTLLTYSHYMNKVEQLRLARDVKQKEQLRLARLLLPVVFMAIGAYIGCTIGEMAEDNRIAQRENEEKTKEKVEDEYEDIGEAVVYQTLLSDKNELDDEPSSANYHLFMKSHGGENFYYLGFYNGSKKYLLEKGSWTKKGMHFNARYYYSPFYFYTNVSAWSSSGSSSGGSTRVIHDDSPRAVQEWVPCPVCGYSGRVGLCQHCNGTGQDLYYTREYRDCPNCGGLKRCPNCGGNGGHYETRYR